MHRFLLLTLCVIALPQWAAADPGTGDWGGRASVRGNYYWENSTRVVAPQVLLSLQTPVGTRIDASYLIDSVTSASQAQGVQADIAFTEIRHDASLGLAHEIDLGNSQLELSARSRYSIEPDYTSRGFGFGGLWSFNRRLSVLSLNGYFIRDDVGKVVRLPVASGDALFDSNREKIGDLNALSLGLAWTQVLTPWMVATVGYDISNLDGYQANVHRTAPITDGPPQPEEHPRHRAREAFYFQTSQHLGATRTTLRVGYRYYHDSWSIHAHNPEVRLYQELGDYMSVRLLYRYYWQSAAFFFNEDGYTTNSRYRTFDPKMESFRNHSYGFQTRLSMDFLSFTAFDFARSLELDFSFELVDSTARYGDGVLAQAGMNWPF